MSEPVRVAVIGASGMMGQLRVEYFSAEARAQVVMACGRDLEKLREAVPDTSIRLAADPAKALAAADVDAVVVCTPNALHYDLVKQALQAGKHVHCEYALTDDLDQYDELVELARKQGRVLHHGLTVRAESLHFTMKEALPDLGEPRAAYYRYYGGAKWYVEPALRGDLFCALHIHFIEQFVDLFGQPEGITAHGVERDGKVSAVVLMQWSGGLTGTIEFAMGFTDKPHYLGTIVTTDGWCGFSGLPVLHVAVHQGGQCTATVPPPDTSKEEDAASFLDEVLGTGGPLSDLATGRKALALCLECSRQLRVGGA